MNKDRLKIKKRQKVWIGCALTSVSIYFFIVHTTQATSPTFSGTISNQTLTEDSANNNLFDLDTYFSDSDPGDSCTYSAPNDFYPAPVTLDADGTLDITSASTSGGQLYPTSANPVLLIHGDESNASTNIIDSGIRGRGIVVNGSAQISTAQSKFGGSSIVFNGSTDTITIADNSDVSFGSGDFTIEFWVYFNSTTGVDHVANQWITSTSYAPWAVYRNGTTLLLYMSSTNSSWAIANGVTMGTVSATTWHHVAITRSGTDIRAFVDGVRGSTTSTAASLYNTNGPIIFGNRDAGTGDAYLNGYIDEFRITDDSALYTANFTPDAAAFSDTILTSRIFDATTSVNWNTLAWTPYIPSLKQLPNSDATETAYLGSNANMSTNIFLYHLNETGSPTSFTDNSGNGTTGSCTGAACPTDITGGKFSGAMSFDQGDYINATSNAVMDDVSVKTVEAWIYPTGWGESSSGRIVMKANANSNGFNFFVNGSSSVNRLGWLQHFSGSTAQWDSANNSIQLNAWQHVVAVYDNSSSSNTPTFYINGQASTTGTTTAASGSATTDNAQTMYIGGRYNGGVFDRQFKGYIDEVAIYNSALSATEILNHYLRGASKTRLQVRSCNDAACSGETFQGTDGTTSTYYTEASNTDTGLPSLSLTSSPTTSAVPANRYFQYRMYMQAENMSATSYLPRMRAVTITASNGTYADTANVASGFAGGTSNNLSYSKDTSDTVQLRCTDTTSATASSNTFTIRYAQTFTAAATGNWNVGTTWGGSCSSSCTEGTDYPTYSDTVNITGGYTVSVPTATTASFSALNIGGATAGTLNLTGNIDTGTNITINANGILDQKNTTQQSISGTLDVQGTLQHTLNSGTQVYELDFSAATITVSGTVTATGKGFTTGSGTGGGDAGGSASLSGGGGGAHGGYGGAGNGSSNKSVGYGDPAHPVILGSGGGSAYSAGSANYGGGLIQLVASGNITVSGSILANGNSGSIVSGNEGTGGGSGGGIYINAGGNANFTSASVKANGGSGVDTGHDSGGGGGGRIAIIYGGTYTAPTTLQAFGGEGPAGGVDGGTGTIYVKSGSNNGVLTLDNGSVVNSSGTAIGNTNNLGSELTTGTNLTITDLTLSNTTSLLMPATSINTISGTLTVNSGNTLTLKSYTNATSALSVGTLTMAGTLDHTDHTTSNSSLAHKIKISASTVTISGTVDVGGLGYSGRASNTAGLGSGAGAAGSGAIGGGGAGHGGAGGNGSSASSPTGIGGGTYDTAAAPVDLGSGGGGSNNSGSTGGDGGGAVEISASGTMTINGSITSNGSNGAAGGGYGAGGGAGGSIYLTYGTLSGIGSLTANGGTGGNGATTKGGGGGGGLIALSGTYNFSGTTSCTGGSATSTATAGNDCTVYGIPNTPSITSPTASQTGVSRNPTTTSSTYAGIGAHNTSDWQISDNNTFSDSDCSDTNIVWCKMSDNTNKTSITVDTTNGTFQNALVGQTQLATNTTYYIRVRHTNSSGNSSWSSSITFTTTAVSNAVPVASSTSINTAAASVTLTENTTTAVTVTTTVTDTNGCSDIASAQAKFYRTSVGSGAADDDNNHYTVSCTQDGGSCGGGGDNTATYTCTINTQYFADPTDAASVNSTDNWTALITPSDATESGTTDSDTIEMNTLTALNVTSSVSYGTLALGANTDTTNQSTTITNTGNEGIDVSVSGYGSSPADGYALSCTIGKVSIGNEEYSTSTFDYDLAGTALTGSATEIDLDIAQRTDASTTGTLYWGMGMPTTGVDGSCSGTITFTAVSDPNID
ncbi:MAG: LamG domain-containing protein [Candidatus Kerfeldbacteria bacterium]|nr:LamG domain-containing protein [Candidatus Kerfeldbacteria bacterium]